MRSMLVDERAYLDFKRLFRLNAHEVGFVLRTKANTKAHVYGHQSVESRTGALAN